MERIRSIDAAVLTHGHTYGGAIVRHAPFVNEPAGRTELLDAMIAGVGDDDIPGEVQCYTGWRREFTVSGSARTPLEEKWRRTLGAGGACGRKGDNQGGCQQDVESHWWIP